jgi:hypothetical protein
MKKGFRERHIARKWLLTFVIVAVVLFVVWFLLFGVVECDSFSCFDDRLLDCSPTVFVGGDEMTVYEYEILGRSGDSCDVRVTLLQGFLDRENSLALEGKFMLCSLPFGVSNIRPESDISSCTGPLKEAIQDRIIQKLHTHIVQNIGRINLDVLDIPSSFVSGSSE